MSGSAKVPRSGPIRSSSEPLTSYPRVRHRVDPAAAEVLRPGVVVGREAEAGRGDAARQRLVGEQLADQRAVVGRRDDRGDPLVDRAQQRGLGHAERRVLALGGRGRGRARRGRRCGRTGATARRGRQPDGGTVTRCTCDGGSDAPQRSRMSGISCTAQNHEPILDSRAGSRIVSEELRVGDVAAVLDVLLPLRRDLAHQVAHRQHEVDLGVAERVERARHLRRRRAGEDLVADDRGAVPVAHLLGEPVPRADGLGLEPAPRQRHQVERGEEVRVEAVARDRGCRARAAPSGCGRGRPGGRTCRSWGSRRGAAPACSPLHLLSRRAVRVRQPGSTTIRIARSSTCRSSGPAGPDAADAAARGARSARSPTTE